MLKLLVEFGPIIVFFGTYKYSDIFFATLLMMIVTCVGLVVSYMIDKKISIPLLISGVVLFITAVITLVSGDPMFIKMKPTIVFAIFSAILGIGCMRKQGLAKHIFASAVKMRDEAWIILSKRFALYFLVVAIVNEIVWRNFSEEFWVNFKVFGFVPITMSFIISQLPFLYRNLEKDS